MKIPAIIVDLDGTLYNAKERQDKHLRGDKKDFDAFHADAHLDDPHAWCADLVRAMAEYGFTPLFVSGRDDTYRPHTEMWLKAHVGGYLSCTSPETLIMRPAGDYTPDDELKEKFYRELIEPKYNVLFCIDDRQRVVDMWRRIGLTCLQCDVGNF